MVETAAGPAASVPAVAPLPTTVAATAPAAAAAGCRPGDARCCLGAGERRGDGGGGSGLAAGVVAYEAEDRARAIARQAADRHSLLAQRLAEATGEAATGPTLLGETPEAA